MSCKYQEQTPICVMKLFIAAVGACSFLALAGCATNRDSTPVAANVPTLGGTNLVTPIAETLLDHLAGKWVLTGKIGGKQTIHDVDAEWVLNREYMRLHEVSRERDTQGKASYEAIIFIGWDAKSGEYACLWLDSTAGNGLSNETIGRGKRSGASIPFLFRLSETSKLHTTFSYAASTGTWEWVIDDEEGGNLQNFARVMLTRQHE
jgi:hypothetical protein